MAFMDHDYDKFPELTNRQLQEFQFSSPHVQITEDFRAEVVKVTDGDTIRVKTDFRDFDFPIRLLGIDSKELSEGGESAKEWLTTEILGKEVQVLIDSGNRIGKYGRLLGKISFGGLDVGETELQLGLAVPFGSKKEGEVPESSFYFRLNQWF